jgi:hypothetical protein
MGLLSAAEIEAPSALREIKNITLIVGEQPYAGDLLPMPTDAGFRFRWAETGDVLTFRWRSLEKSERNRVLKLYGLTEQPGTLSAWGGQISGVRFRLSGGWSDLLGVECPERSLMGFRCLKNRQQTYLVPRDLIAGEERVELRESDILTPKEGYARLLEELRRTPGSADAYVRAAMECAHRRWYGNALDLLARAYELDPGTKEGTAAFCRGLVEQHAMVEATVQYHRIISAIRHEDIGTARFRLTEFARAFPTSSYATFLSREMPCMEPPTGASSAVRPVSQESPSIERILDVGRMYHAQVTELLRERLVSQTPAASMYRVTTCNGELLTGRLVSEENGQVVLETKELRVTAPRAKLVSCQLVDPGFAMDKVRPSLKELRAYIDDAAKGLEKDVVSRIARTLGMGEEDVRVAWRAHVPGVVGLRGVPICNGKANYWKGTWLREGNAMPGDGATLHADYADDPETWWAVQDPRTQLQILRAFAAERLFDVREITHVQCTECLGEGVLKDTHGFVDPVRCPVCRGQKTLCVVVYR